MAGVGDSRPGSGDIERWPGSARAAAGSHQSGKSERGLVSGSEGLLGAGSPPVRAPLESMWQRLSF
jgi:hypothetical protein